MDSIKNQTRRLNHLVKNLLELSCWTNPPPAELFTEVDLSALVGEVAESFEVLVCAAGKTFFTEIQPGVTLAGSREELYKLTSILLDNALKYTNDGGTIRVSLQKQRRVALSVYNTCAYMDPEKTGRLFERFYRADELAPGRPAAAASACPSPRPSWSATAAKFPPSAPDGKSITFTAVFSASVH